MEQRGKSERLGWMELGAETMEEHSIGLLASLVAGHPEELVGRVLALVRKAKGEDDGIGLEMLGMRRKSNNSLRYWSLCSLR